MRKGLNPENFVKFDLKFLKQEALTHKYLILIISFLFIGINGNSQETEPLEIKKWTLRSNVFSQPYTFERRNPLPSFFTGIGAKMNFQKVSIRLSFDQINYTNKLEFEKINKKENTYRIGAEYKKRYYEYINLNFFVDFIISDFDKESSVNALDTIANFYETHKGNAMGANVGIGFDYFFTPSFSLGLETRLDLLHYSGDVTREDYLNNYSVNYFNSFNDLNLNILGNFSLNYHF